MNKSLNIEFLWVVIGALAYIIIALLGSHRKQWFLSSLAILLLFGFGFLRLKEHRLDNLPNHLSKTREEITAYRARVYEEPSLKTNSINVKLHVLEVYTGQWQSASGKVNAYVDAEIGNTVLYGDVLVIKGSPVATEPPANPGEFDFRNYLVYNNIFHQHFVGDNFQVVGSKVGWWQMPLAYSIQARNYCTGVLKSRIKNDQSQAVLLALVLGVKDELDPELQASFSAAGAMHVLAVSGLHVGIIYAIFLWLFKKIKLNSWKRRWWMALASIAILWGYAFLTGLSPSVLRAVTMFSFVALAKARNTHSNIYNTLAASAFVLLCWNPYLIMSVGFQLSYLAVFGIVYLQPRFYALLEFDHLLPDKIWEITCVSLAAQLATAPLSILYFHQFPTYFLLSNLFIIPAAFLMLILGITVLALGGVPILGAALNWFTEHLVWCVNGLVHGVRKIPGSTWEGIHLTTAESWMVYAMVLLLIVLFERRRFSYLIMAGMCCLLLTLSQSSHWSQYHNLEFSVLSVSGESVLDFRVGNESRLIADSSFYYNPDKVQFHLEPKRQLAGTNLLPENDRLNIQIEDLKGNRLIVFYGKTILHLTKSTLLKLDFEESIRVDYLVLTNESVTELDELKRKVEFEELIIDKSNRKFLADRLTNQAENLNLKVHSLYRDGYYSKLWKK